MHPPKKPVPFALRHWFALLMCLLLLLTLAKVIEMLTVGLPGLLFGIPTLLLLVALLILLPMLHSRARAHCPPARLDSDRGPGCRAREGHQPRDRGQGSAGAGSSGPRAGRGR